MNQDRTLVEPSNNEDPPLRSWHEWEFDGRERRIILCVETSLELRVGCDGFDPVKLDQLMSEAAAMMRASASPIDSIRIVPER